MDVQTPDDIEQNIIEQTKLSESHSLFINKDSYIFYFQNVNEHKNTFLMELYYRYYDIKDITVTSTVNENKQPSVDINLGLARFNTGLAPEKAKHNQTVPDDSNQILTKVLNKIFERDKVAIIINRFSGNNLKSEIVPESILKLREKNYILISGSFMVNYRADIKAYVLFSNSHTDCAGNNNPNLTIQTFIPKTDVIQESQRARFEIKLKDGEPWEIKILGKVEEYSEPNQKLVIYTYLIYNF